MVWMGLILTFGPKDQPKSTVLEVSSSGAGAGEFHAEPLPERLTRGRYIVEGPRTVSSATVSRILRMRWASRARERRAGRGPNNQK